MKLKVEPKFINLFMNPTSKVKYVNNIFPIIMRLCASAVNLNLYNLKNPVQIFFVPVFFQVPF